MALLWDANIHYWTHWIMLVPTNAGLVFGTAIGGWALWRWHRSAALIVLGCAAIGVAQTVAHPQFGELDRLYVLAWLATVTGLPVAVHRFTERHAGHGDLPVRDLVGERTLELSIAGTRS